jgi:carboxynorspermidine decarboxylase
VTAAVERELETPFFLISEHGLRLNLERIDRLKVRAGAKVLLALKCFSTWGIFDVIRPHLDGTAASSPYEARLGHETFGGETFVYSPGFSAAEIAEVAGIADKVIFNSLSQLRSLRAGLPPTISVGLRVNPEVSFARQHLADPARAGSRLGVRACALPPRPIEGVDGLPVHVNCENDDYPSYGAILNTVSERFGAYLDAVSWVSLGGGVAFTGGGYPLEECAARIRRLAEAHGVTVYLEPGEAVVARTTDLVVTVLDVMDNCTPTAVVDSATETHRLDTLIYSEPGRVAEASPTGAYEYVIGSRSCLAGDEFCTAHFDRPLKVGDRLHVTDSGGYTMVKLNWFNGLRMPSVYVERLDGTIDRINEFGYEDFKRAMSRRSISRRVG